MESATNWEQDYSKAKVNPVSRVLDAQDVQMVDSPTTLKRVAEVQDAILEMNEDFKNSPQVKESVVYSLMSFKIYRCRTKVTKFLFLPRNRRGSAHPTPLTRTTT